MDCSEFLERFSELEDGLADHASREAAEAHLAGCEECRRYRDVFRRGVDLLRSLETPDVRSDFRPRLQHRIYHLEDSHALDRSGTSGATLLVAAGMTALLSFAAWSPALRAPVAEIEGHPVAARPAPNASPAPAEASASIASSASTPSTAREARQPTLREGAGLPAQRSLLHDYSSFARPDPARSYLRLTGSSPD